MPKQISLQDLLEAKKKYNFSWTWEPLEQLPKKKMRAQHAYFFLTCSKSKVSKWVCFSHLRSGKSLGAHSHKRLPTLEKMLDIADKFSCYWRPSLTFKTVKNRRYYLMKCKCGKNSWVAWSRFSSGKTRGCKPCTKRVSTNPLDSTYHELKRIWYRVNKSKSQKPWTNYKDFKDWALKSGYVEGMNMVLKDRNSKLGYVEENIVWVRKKESVIKNSINIKGY